MERLTRQSRIRDLMHHPLGRDVVDKLMLTLGYSMRWVDNPVVGKMRLDRLEDLVRPVVGHGFVDTLLTLLNDAPDHLPVRDGDIRPTWWKEAVFYQVYQRSLQACHGDGFADIRGSSNRIDHIAGLGGESLWRWGMFAPTDQA